MVERQHRKREPESAKAMVLLAAIEASFRVDYFKRCDQKMKDQLSREFRKLYKKKDRRVSLEDEILKLWKLHADIPVALTGEIRDEFKYRHWLAHGRYWVPKFGRSYDFFSVYRLADTVNREFSLKR